MDLCDCSSLRTEISWSHVEIQRNVEKAGSQFFCGVNALEKLCTTVTHRLPTTSLIHWHIHIKRYEEYKDVNSMRQGHNSKWRFKKAEVIPPRDVEPKLVPTAEAKGFPNPAPKGAWVPRGTESRGFTPLILISVTMTRVHRLICQNAKVCKHKENASPCVKWCL